MSLLNRVVRSVSWRDGSPGSTSRQSEISVSADLPQVVTICCHLDLRDWQTDGQMFCALLQSPVCGGTVLCTTAVSGVWWYCYVRYCSLRYLVILLCALLQSPVFGDTVMCATAVSGIWWYCYVRYCSLRYVVILLCALLQSPVCGGTVMCASAVSGIWWYCDVRYCSVRYVCDCWCVANS